MLKFLWKIWPAITPVIIYLVWYYIATIKKDVKIRDDFIEKKNRYRFYAIISCGIITIALMISFAFDIEPTPDRANIDSRLPVDASTVNEN